MDAFVALLFVVERDVASFRNVRDHGGLGYQARVEGKLAFVDEMAQGGLVGMGCGVDDDAAFALVWVSKGSMGTQGEVR
jgi:hypothetical protein